MKIDDPRAITMPCLTMPLLRAQIGDEMDLRAVRKAGAERLLDAMRAAALLVGPVEPERSPTMVDAGYAMGALAAVRSPLVRACFKTALGQ